MSASPLTNHHPNRLPLSSPHLSGSASPCSSPLGLGSSLRASANNMPVVIGNASTSQSVQPSTAVSPAYAEAVASPVPIRFNLASHRFGFVFSLFRLTF